MNNKRIARIALLILCIVIVALVIGVAATHPLPAAHTQAEVPTSVPTVRATTVPTSRPTSIPTTVPTVAPAATAQPVPTVVPTRAPVPTPKPTVDIATLPAYQLAAIDGADFSDPVVIARYQKVLDSLHDKSGDSEAGIANATYAGQGILTKAGHTGSDNTMIGLMDASDIAFTKDEHLKYADVLGALITLMENPS